MSILPQCLRPIPPAKTDSIELRTDAIKIPEFFEKPPLSGAEKHPDFQVTSCLHNDTTNVNFAYIESE